MKDDTRHIAVAHVQVAQGYARLPLHGVWKMRCGGVVLLLSNLHQVAVLDIPQIEIVIIFV